MKILLLLPLVITLITSYQSPTTVNESSPLQLVSFKWSRARRAIEKQDPNATIPARAMIPANKTFARNARINDPAGVRDPNADTLDGRSAAIEKSVQEARTPQAKPSDGFAYRIKVRNSSARVVEIVFWEYQFLDAADPSLVARRQFLCGVDIKAEKDKELEGFSLSGPSDVVSVGTLASKSPSPFQEKVLINRVEYADGSIWQRKDWDFGEVTRTYERVLREPWSPGMCKGL